MAKMIPMAIIVMFVAVLTFFISLPVLGVISISNNTTTINTTKLIINNTDFALCQGYYVNEMTNETHHYINYSQFNYAGGITECGN